MEFRIKIKPRHILMLLSVSLFFLGSAAFVGTLLVRALQAHCRINAGVLLIFVFAAFVTVALGFNLRREYQRVFGVLRVEVTNNEQIFIKMRSGDEYSFDSAQHILATHEGENECEVKLKSNDAMFVLSSRDLEPADAFCEFVRSIGKAEGEQKQKQGKGGTKGSDVIDQNDRLSGSRIKPV